MSEASEVIAQQFIDGGVVPGQLTGQNAVSKTYVDEQLAIRDTHIAAAAGAAATAQADINNHEASPAAHPAQHITYSGAVAGAANVKQGLDNLNGRISNIVAQAGDDNTEIVDARGGYTVLGDRLNASDAQLADTVKKGDLVVNIKDFGAVGDRVNDDTSAIQNAIESICPLTWDTINPPRGGIVYFPPGSYLISSSLVLPAYVRLVGAGMFATEMYLADGANVDIIKTDGYDNFVGSGLAYYDTSGVPTGFGIESMMIRGNRFNNTSGGGVKIYGYNYTIKDLAIIETASTAFTSRHETGSDSVPFTRNKVKLLESRVENLHIHNCLNRGLEFYGPTDAKLDAIFVGVCYGDRGVHLESSIDIGLMHVYACGETAGGYGVYINGGARFENLISEHNFGEGVRITSWHVAITNLQLYRNCRSSGSYNLTITNTANFVQIGNVEIKLLDVDASGILLSGKYNKIGKALVVGDGVTTYTKDGIRLDGTSEGSGILELLVKGLKGTGAVGLRLNQGGAVGNVTVRGTIEDCATGVNVGSQSAGGSIYDLRVLLNNGQSATGFAINPKSTDNVILLQRDTSGVWSVINSHIPS